MRLRRGAPRKLRYKKDRQILVVPWHGFFHREKMNQRIAMLMRNKIEAIIASIFLASSAHAQNQNIDQQIEAILKSDAIGEECRGATSFFINRGLVSERSCADHCYGMLTVAKLMDLDVGATTIEPYKRSRDRAFVKTPCKSGKKCVSIEIGTRYGHRNGFQCQDDNSSKEHSEFIFIVPDNQADKLLMLIKSLGR